jgi:hypothetical protein
MAEEALRCMGSDLTTATCLVVAVPTAWLLMHLDPSQGLSHNYLINGPDNEDLHFFSPGFFSDRADLRTLLSVWAVRTWYGYTNYNLGISLGIPAQAQISNDEP